MRYKIVPMSCSGHCCFDFTIVDTFENDGDYYKNVSEVFYEEDAILVCKALNLMNSNRCTFEFIESCEIQGDTNDND